MSLSPEKIQEAYYSQTSKQYDQMHVEKDREHFLALELMECYVRYYGIRSILDVGSGTGRVIGYMKERCPEVKVVGVEPVKELREQGYAKGISPDELIGGDGNKLDFKTGSFDLVCSYGVLHHVPQPAAVVAEMLRVGGKGIFISDSNNFGQGSFAGRSMKQLLNALGMWKLFNYLRTGGKRYQISKEDGLFYSYSLFDNYTQVKAACSHVYLADTTGKAGRNIYRSSPTVALFGLKKK